MAETQLSLFQQAVGQGLDKLDEVIADASADLANSLVRSAWNCEIFLNCGRQSGFNLKTDRMVINSRLKHFRQTGLNIPLQEGICQISFLLVHWSLKRPMNHTY